jgi:hypothetical protein
METCANTPHRAGAGRREDVTVSPCRWKKGARVGNATRRQSPPPRPCEIPPSCATDCIPLPKPKQMTLAPVFQCQDTSHGPQARTKQSRPSSADITC